MNKIAISVLIIIALIAVAGIAFYIWLLIAFTPPKVKTEIHPGGTIKQGVIPEGVGLSYIIYWEAESETAPKVYYVMTGTAVDDLTGEVIMEVKGTPVPVDVKLTSPFNVEVVFDGKLTDGTSSLKIKTDNEYHLKEVIKIMNGVKE